MTRSDRATPTKRPEGRRPRLLYVAMYEATSQDSAPKVRIRLLGEALARIADLETMQGDRLGRMRRGLPWLVRHGMGDIDAVYVESPTSTVTPFDLALLAWARLRGRPVGVYFRDAYQLYRDLYPRTRRRQVLADLAWRVTMPALRTIATVGFTPSEGLARVLGIREAVVLPPGTEATAPRLGVGPEPLVAYVGALGDADGFPRLLAAMELVQGRVPGARLRVVSRATGLDLPEWVEVRPGSRADISRLIAPARVCVVPRPINAYTDLAMPLKIADYLSFGKPIVATAATETRTLLERTGAALLVSDDPADLAAAIVRVLTEPGLAEGMAERAAELADRPDLTWDGRAAIVLQSLLGERERPA